MKKMIFLAASFSLLFTPQKASSFSMRDLYESTKEKADNLVKNILFFSTNNFEELTNNFKNFYNSCSSQVSSMLYGTVDQSKEFSIGKAAFELPGLRSFSENDPATTSAQRYFMRRQANLKELND